jgi:hypothetical protein
LQKFCYIFVYFEGAGDAKGTWVLLEGWAISTNTHSHFIFLWVVKFEGKRVLSMNTFFSLGLWRLKDERGFIQYSSHTIFLFFLGSIKLKRGRGSMYNFFYFEVYQVEGIKAFCLVTVQILFFFFWFYQIWGVMRFDLVSGRAYYWTIQLFGWPYAKFIFLGLEGEWGRKRGGTC